MKNKIALFERRGSEIEHIREPKLIPLILMFGLVTIDIHELPTGVFIFKFTTNGSEEQFKLFKE